MKKAKIILSAITIFATISGAAAYEAQKSAKFIYYETNLNGPCNIPLTSITPTTTTVASFLSYAFTPTTGPCPSLGYFTAAGLND